MVGLSLQALGEGGKVGYGHLAYVALWPRAPHPLTCIWLSCSLAHAPARSPRKQCVLEPLASVGRVQEVTLQTSRGSEARRGPRELLGMEILSLGFGIGRLAFARTQMGVTQQTWLLSGEGGQVPTESWVTFQSDGPPPSRKHADKGRFCLPGILTLTPVPGCLNELRPDPPGVTGELECPMSSGPQINLA